MRSVDDQRDGQFPVTDASGAALVVERLSVSYGKAQAVHQVSLELRAGQVTALLGPNGAGKSSALLAIYGSVPSKGSVVLDGQALDGRSVRDRARAGLAIVPQGRQLFPRLTVQENLRVMAEMLGVGKVRVNEELRRFPILESRASSLAGVLSGGEQQMLAVARAMLANPTVLLLDEPVTGLAPIIVSQLMGTIAALSAAGTAVLLAQPAIGSAASAVDRGYVLVRGELVGSSEAGSDALEHSYRAALGIS